MIFDEEGEIRNMAYIDIKDLIIDKEFEELLPVLSPEELENLENSILQYGLLDPIKIWQEPDTGEWIIIDGHNRYNILKKHNIDWHYWQDYKIMSELETREDVKQWMFEQQLGRRNLSPEEKYDIVQKFKDMLQKKAKQNQSSGGKGKSNLKEVNVQKEMAKATGISVGSYYKLDYIKKHGSEEINRQLHDKEISIDKAFQMVKNPKPTEKESITPEQRIIQFDNRMNEIDKEISSLKTERETLMRRRRSLFESLDIPFTVKYRFSQRKGNPYAWECQIYIEFSDKEEILYEGNCYFDERPSDVYLRHVPEKYQNDFEMVWDMAHKEVVNENEKYNEKEQEENKKLDEFLKDIQEFNNFAKLDKAEFYVRKFHKDLIKIYHPDNIKTGDNEAMQYLNKLKALFGI